MNDQPLTQPLKGNLFIISGPSGTGKTSLINAIMQQIPHLSLSVSATTRPKRSKEIDGIHYHFMRESAFKTLIDQGGFSEYARVFNHYYGTPKASIEDSIAKGHDLLLEIDWQGAKSIRTQFQCTSIFILPPDKASLHHRLTQRKQDTPAIIAERLAQAKQEITHYQQFDYLIVNQDLKKATKELCAIITARPLTQQQQAQKQATRIKALLTD